MKDDKMLNYIIHHGNMHVHAQILVMQLTTQEHQEYNINGILGSYPVQSIAEKHRRRSYNLYSSHKIRGIQIDSESRNSLSAKLIFAEPTNFPR